MISKCEAIKRFFSTADKPVTARELLELRRVDVPEFDTLAAECAQALGEELDQTIGTPVSQ